MLVGVSLPRAVHALLAALLATSSYVGGGYRVRTGDLALQGPRVPNYTNPPLDFVVSVKDIHQSFIGAREATC